MRRLASNAGLLTLSMVVNAACTLLVQVFSARALPIEVFGLYAASSALVAMIESMVVSRAGDLALNFVGESMAQGRYALARGQARQIIRSDVLITAVVTVAVAVSGWALSGWLAIEPLWTAVLALSIVVQAGYGVNKNLLVVQHRIRVQAALEIAYSLFWAMASLAAVWAWGALGLALAYLAGSVLRSGAAHLAVRSIWPTNEASTAADLPARTLWAWSGQALARNAVMRLSGQIDLFILAAVAGPVAVGQYKVAKTLSALPVRVAGPVWGALRPALYNAWMTADRSKFFRLIAYPSLIMLAFAIPGLGLVGLIGKDLLTRFYGADYAGAFVPLLFLLGGCWAFQGANGWFEFWILFSRRRYWSTVLYALFCLAVAAAAPMLQHVAGVDGEALSLAAIMAVLFCLMSFAAWGVVLLTRCPDQGGPSDSR
ncbi:MAG: oligosaccharide flippase family protein [Magnetospirillum sp.]|nr:oligosaccharide flippase family protein [Magnetospirillum sp.]